ncbi:MAG: PspC domain-containing protein [Massilia sp.]|jgi:phage shock protein C|uniref:PspC domain-containing protein n=1 Tax=Massilia sp. TaxID=1882437 RepID=UPI0019C04777|nr:PspC domain-containing protein [Oxalobacteraceae sp. CFBP 8761]MBD8626363.1 PspC domain-containing protein [Oxalobacteraceae sp. CFBP 8753]MBD8630850.1 PspC domain-containing protein [Oxalobacteraceae sp. CFBP 8755]MBD8725857.1 PspC domain-containing protein [Oxalobacteraceae sp. CFBP 13708]
MLSDEIKRLHELHQAGALSDAEFEQAKARILSGASTVSLTKESAFTSGSSFDTHRDDLLSGLRRTRLDRWLGGVCGGLARTYGLESWVWRLIFVLFVLTFGFGILIYLLLWVFVPEE